jgi:hypothetical protein
VIIITSYKRFENETDEELIYRVCSDKDLIGSWQDVADILNELLGSEYTESKFRKQFQAFNKMLNANRSKFADSDEQIKEIEVQKRELEKERKKLQSEKIEYNKWLREEARDELIAEKICEAITSLDKYSSPMRISLSSNKKSWILAISDCHYGCEYEIKDFYGGIINAYSPEIFEERMTILFNKVVDKIEDLGIKELSIIELGDGIDGVLRMSQLMRLRYGVIESSIRYADYLANWLNELSKYVSIKFQMVYDSNHNQLRLLDGKKNTFPDENVSKIMMALIKERLKDNENIVILENPTGMTYSIMSTYCVVGFHGEKKNLKNNLLEMSRTYGVHIDYTISGHIHHDNMAEIGLDSAVLSVGSVIGIDPYSMTLNAASNASCSMFEFTQGEGRTAEYVFKLN